MPLQGKVGFSRKSKQNLLPHRVMQNFTSDYFEGACTVSIIFKTYFNFENIYIYLSFRQVLNTHCLSARILLPHNICTFRSYLKEFQTWKVIK